LELEGAARSQAPLARNSREEAQVHAPGPVQCAITLCLAPV
jgi:hypothetical protein